MSLINDARKIISVEIDGLVRISDNLDYEFDTAIKSILDSSGRVIICGMGKSGIIGRKISASFASTGTPSFFMHPGEAFHGDLGMVLREDVFIAISNSGETEEVLKLLPFLKDNGNYIISMTGNPKSSLAVASNCHLNISVPKEACPYQLAPTVSTTATLAMGDALTICLMEERKFKPENFARFHPGGALGRKLLRKVSNEMISNNLPFVYLTDAFETLITVITEGMLGLAIVIDDDNNLYGIVTDGDLRRVMHKFSEKVFSLKVEEIFTKKPATINPEESIANAYELMELKKISSLVVVNDNNDIVGILKK